MPTVTVPVCRADFIDEGEEGIIVKASTFMPPWMEEERQVLSPRSVDEV